MKQFLKNADRAGTYGADYGARVLENTVSEEPDVRILALKVALGQGDAGVVYISDVTNDLKDKVKTIPIPSQINIIAEYGIGVVKNSARLDAAKAFYNLVLSPEGQAVLVKNGLLLEPIN